MSQHGKKDVDARRDAESVLREQAIGEYQLYQELQQRRAILKERFPSIYSRVALLEKLAMLQQSRGGEFPPKVVFIHMADYILNVRRLGVIDIEALLVAVEVYEHNDIVPGIVWVPLDHIWWAGTTDAPINTEQMGLRNKQDPDPALPLDYQAMRLRLAGMLPREKQDPPLPAIKLE
ncbi:MAG TPA: hypothetical protein VGP72_21845 [Planctomycetota bacterium]|jgi:hypothetical protein